MNTWDKNVNMCCNNVGDTFMNAQQYFSKDKYLHIDDEIASDIITSLKSSHDVKEFVSYLKSHKRLEEDAVIAILTEMSNVQNEFITKIKKQSNSHTHECDTVPPLPELNIDDNLAMRLQIYHYSLTAINFVDALN